uniref:Uncharacterized protein n=1 Tax=Mycena chlorophos TaxID=658473 RepID=A0ABQ0LEP3_MYCCL|nr:predicted protein [Mycena chlorophos]
MGHFFVESGTASATSTETNLHCLVNTREKMGGFDQSETQSDSSWQDERQRHLVHGLIHNGRHLDDLECLWVRSAVRRVTEIEDAVDKEMTKPRSAAIPNLELVFAKQCRATPPILELF